MGTHPHPLITAQQPPPRRPGSGMIGKPSGRRWSSPEVAPLAARALLKHSMNATRAAKELRPHLTEQSARKTGSRLIHTPAVLAELDKLTDDRELSERSAKAYISSLWGWLERPQSLADTSNRVSRHELQLGLQAARILARLYIRGRFEATPPNAFHIDGFDNEGIRNLTGDDCV